MDVTPKVSQNILHKNDNKRIYSSVGKRSSPYQWNIVWSAVIVFLYSHLGAIYGIYLAFTSARLFTLLWSVFLHNLTVIGGVAGAHRLWSHKAYKATFLLRLMLIICHTTGIQNPTYDWARGHRNHHKFLDTDADPHNSKRGLFFSHIGWLILMKHDMVKVKGQSIDVSDLNSDQLLVFQKRFYVWMVLVIAIAVPTTVPIYFWNESFANSWHIAVLLRLTVSWNCTFLVNSMAHSWGRKPYEKSISATDSVLCSLLTGGEGWHNYHHAFPWDYKGSEYPGSMLNWITILIEFWAKLGLSYDLSSVPVNLINKRALRTGDGSRFEQNK